MRIIEQLRVTKAMGRRAIPLMFKMFYLGLIYPKIFAQLKEAPEDYDLKPKYEIPKYEEWMKIPDFDKDELYLRPTKDCECDSPEIVALAYKLAYKHKLEDKLSDWDYAENVFKWIKHNIKFNIAYGTAKETLEEGVGVCVSQVTLFIALCRANGLKARYKVLVSIELDPRMQEIDEDLAKELGVGQGQILRNLIDGFANMVPAHILLDVQIDGRWVSGEPTLSEEVEAGMGFKISKLGGDPEWINKAEKVYYLEDPPWMVRPLLKRSKSLRGLQYMLNKKLESDAEKGREILKLGKERYEAKMKKEYEGLSKELSDIMKRTEQKTHQDD